MSAFRQHYHTVDPETLALLEITLNETWKAVRSKGTFDAVSTRAAIADLTMAVLRSYKSTITVIG
jgi:hypothetical protein